MPAPISIRLIGTLRIEAAGGSGGPVNEARLGPLGRLALAYLAVERHRPVARDELADVLWGEHPPTWTAALRGVIARVRAVLAAAGLPGDEGVVSEAGCYQLRLPDTAVLDVEAADRALQVARAALATGDTPLAVDAASEAVSLTGGQFLAGATGAWVERRQSEVAERHQAALEVLSEAACASGDSAIALRRPRRRWPISPSASPPTCASWPPTSALETGPRPFGRTSVAGWPWPTPSASARRRSPRRPICGSWRTLRPRPRRPPPCPRPAACPPA